MAVDSMGRWISSLHRQGQVFMARELAEHGLSNGQHLILLMVCENPGAKQEKYCELLAMNKGTVARALKQLETNGFVQRDVDENNRRANMVYPTEKATQVQERMYELMQQWDAIITESMNGSEKILLKSMLRRANENAVTSVRPQFIKRRRRKFSFNTKSE